MLQLMTPHPARVPNKRLVSTKLNYGINYGIILGSILGCSGEMASAEPMGAHSKPSACASSESHASDSFDSLPHPSAARSPTVPHAAAPVSEDSPYISKLPINRKADVMLIINV